MKRIKNTFKIRFAGFFSQTHFWLSQIDTPFPTAKFDGRCEASEIQVQPGDEFNLPERGRAVALRPLETRLFQMPGLLITQGATPISK